MHYSTGKYACPGADPGESREGPRKHDLGASTRSLLANWGPAVLLIAAGTALQQGLGRVTLASGILWSAGAIWSGFSCARNALRCGRFHCTILGVAHPLFGLAALAITVRLLPMSWELFWDFLFWPATVAAFVPELFGLRYLRRVAISRVDRPRTVR